MRKLTVTVETFGTIISDLIASGVTFEANEIPNGIEIIFTGGY